MQAEEHKNQILKDMQISKIYWCHCKEILVERAGEGRPLGYKIVLADGVSYENQTEVEVKYIYQVKQVLRDAAEGKGFVRPPMIKSKRKPLDIEARRRIEEACKNESCVSKIARRAGLEVAAVRWEIVARGMDTFTYNAELAQADADKKTIRKGEKTSVKLRAYHKAAGHDGIRRRRKKS